MTCTTASNSQCSACPSGFYLNETGPSDTCSLCSPIDGCISPITCTSATTSQCTQCAAGTYVSDGVADACPTCTAVAHCVAPVTCTTAGDCTCSLCQSGFFSDQVGPSTICTQCTDVIGCISPPTCTTASNSQCTACDVGRYLSEGLADTCPDCTPIPNCTSLTCTNGSNSQCTSCAAPTVDDFNCYKVKDLKVPPFVRTGVSVADQFATSPVTLIKPALLCAPAGVDGSSVANSQTHLCCYKSKAAKLPAPVRAEVTDQLGPRQVEV